MRAIIVRCTCLVAWALVASRLTAADPPSVVVRDITLLAGQTFQMPLHGIDPGNSPLSFSLVSISDNNVTGALTHGNRSLRLNVTGKDASGTNDFAGALVFELFDDLTSNTTARISALVETNFYNGLTFHRIIDNFVAQGGDPKGDGTGGSGVVFKDEFSTNLTFTGFGQLAMANAGDDSNDSQFFITDVDLSWDFSGGVTNPPPASLNFNHTIFGQLTAGFDVLDTLMHTPVGFFNGEVSKPVFPVTITAATIFTNHNDAVLRLSAARGFTGTVLVTVSALNTNNVATQTAFHVRVIPDPLNNRPFLDPLPATLTITQNTLGMVKLSANDLENDPLSPVAIPGFGLQATFNGTFQGYVLIPDPGFTGMVSTVIGVRDQTSRGSGGLDEYDTETIQVAVVPGSATPTMDLVLRKGVVLNTSTPDVDQVTIQASLKFNSQSPAPSFDPTTEPFLLVVGGPAGPVELILAPGDPGWKGKNGKFTWESPKVKRSKKSAAGPVLKMKLTLDTRKGRLTFTAKSFNFVEQQTNPVQFRLATGRNWALDERNWRAKTTGWLVFP